MQLIFMKTFFVGLYFCEFLKIMKISNNIKGKRVPSSNYITSVSTDDSCGTNKQDNI